MAAGLDLDALRALRSPHPHLNGAVARLSGHLDAYDGYVAFSGGKDSLVALDLALQADPTAPVVFFDSGAEFPETYAYLEQIREVLSVEIEVVAAAMSTWEYLAATGAWDHASPDQPMPTSLLENLISAPVAQAHDRYGPGSVWGLRAQESRSRRALLVRELRRAIERDCEGCCGSFSEQRAQHGGVVHRQDGTVSYSPVWAWSTDDVLGYAARRGLPLNPVYAKLRALGADEQHTRVSHMLDATGLESGRVTWLRRGWPEMFEEIAAVLPRIREFV